MKKLNEVLLIDDDNINNHLNKLLVTELGITDRVQVVLDGYQALDYINQHLGNCPQLILLDINMPAMDGFEFLDALDKIVIPNKQELVIVMLTTSKNPRDMATLKRFGDYDYISKPLTEEKLIHILQKHFSYSGDTFS